MPQLILKEEGRRGEGPSWLVANEAFSLKSASVRWAGWATVTYGRVGKLKTRVGKRKKFFSALRAEFCPPWPETLPAPLRPYSQLGRGVGCLESTNPAEWSLAYFYVALLQFSSPFSAQTLLVGRLEEHPACKNVGCLFVGSDSLTGALHILYLQFVATTSFILSSSEIHNGDIVVPAYPYCPGKWLLNERSFTFAVSQARCPSALSYWILTNHSKCI